MARGGVGMSPSWSLPLMALWFLCRVAGAQSSITAQRGEDVTLHCTFYHIDGVKLQRLNITWKMQRAEGADFLVHSYYGHVDLWQGQDKAYWRRTQLYRERFHEGNASLRLMGVRFQDEGSYFCHVKSELGSSTQKISLMVLREREIDSPIIAHLGEDVTLSCPFEFGLNLQSLNITWKKEEAEGPDLLVHSYYHGMDKLQRQDATYKDRTQLHPERFSQGNASLTLKRVRTQDKGFYICLVKPELGRFSVRMQVIVEGSVNNQTSPALYCILLLDLLLLIMVIIIITEYCRYLMQKLRIFQRWFKQKQQKGRDQPESNSLTANESERPHTFLTPPANSLQMTDLNRRPYGEVTTRCRGHSPLVKPDTDADTQSSSSGWQPERPEQHGRAVTDVVWEDLALPSDGDVAELKAAIETKDPPGLTSALQEISEAVKNARLKVAVIGEAGSGKSSFVNATRGLKEESTGAAESGVVEIVVEPKAYPHPQHPNVMLWDLPGIGSMNCPSDTFFEQGNFREYDLFIIITCGRFTSTDAKLVEEIKKLGKTFYLVRSKVDLDLEAAQKRNSSEESTLEKIRADCLSHVEGETEVFLISSWHPDKFDFQHLQQTLDNEYRHHRAHALHLALSNSSLPILQKRKGTL